MLLLGDCAGVNLQDILHGSEQVESPEYDDVDVVEIGSLRRESWFPCSVAKQLIRETQLRHLN